MTTKHTGGTWGPAIAPYRYFTAGQNNARSLVFYRSRLLAVNELRSADSLTDEFEPLLAAGVPVLLDSGVFWLANTHATTHGIPMDAALALPPEELDGWEELYANYCRLVQMYGDRVWGYIELDQGGRAQKCRTRAGLEAQGFAPIPVYHPLNDGWDYFDALCQQYDRICVGNVVQAALPLRTRIFATIWERQRQYPAVWIHYLGVTPHALQIAYPVQSCDSSSWLGVLRWKNRISCWTDVCLAEVRGYFERGFYYERGPEALPEAGRLQGGTCAAYHAALVQQNWQAILGAYAALGMQPYPPRRPQERPLMPAHP